MRRGCAGAANAAASASAHAAAEKRESRFTGVDVLGEWTGEAREVSFAWDSRPAASGSADDRQAGHLRAPGRRGELHEEKARAPDPPRLGPTPPPAPPPPPPHTPPPPPPT